MINVKELRIGNFISDGNMNVGFITSIDRDLNMIQKTYRVFYNVNGETYASDISDIFGIELTKDILSQIIALDKFYALKISELSIISAHHNKGLEVMCKYLHQLQNKYFEILDIELDFNYYIDNTNKRKSNK